YPISGTEAIFFTTITAMARLQKSPPAASSMMAGSRSVAYGATTTTTVSLTYLWLTVRTRVHKTISSTSITQTVTIGSTLNALGPHQTGRQLARRSAYALFTEMN